MGSLHSQKEIVGLQLPVIENIKLFFCVLNWGIGHATRSIPIIEKLLKSNNEIILMSDGEAGQVLKRSFPDLAYHELSSYKIKYDNNLFPFLSLMVQSIIRSKTIYQEHREIARLIEELKPAVIISDNRYGCYHRSTKNYLITHQLRLVSRSKLLMKGSAFFAEKLIKSFDEVWIPDIENVYLSGEMSKISTPVRKRYIGFPTEKYQNLDPIKSDILFLLSGPEPKRTEIQKQLQAIASRLQRKTVFIAGDFIKDYEEFQEGDFQFFSRKKYEEVLPYIAGAHTVVCRSGYSTLIDLYCLNKKNIICIPTKGQPEQEYLARYWQEKGWIDSISEDEIESKLLKILN